MDLDLGVLGVSPCSSSHIPPYFLLLWWDLGVGDLSTSGALAIAFGKSV